MTKSLRRAAVAAALSMAPFALGCASSAREPERPREHPVVAKAEFDMECPRAQLAFTRIDANTIGARGCGRQATYVRVCRQDLNERAARWGMVDVDTHCQYVLQHIRERASSTATFAVPAGAATAAP